MPARIDARPRLTSRSDAMTRLLTAALILFACSSTSPKVFGQAKGTMAVSSVTVTGATATITVSGTVSGLAAGWDLAEVSGTALDQGNAKVAKPTSEVGIQGPQNGIYNYTCTF